MRAPAPPPLPDRSAIAPPGSSKGMPRKEPANGRARAGQPETPADASDEASLALPHERDQETDMTDRSPDPKVQQASTDLRRGLTDTDKGPPLDAAYDKLKQR